MSSCLHVHITDHINKRTDKKQAEDGGQLASMLVQDVPGEPSHDSVAAEMCSDGCSHCQVEHCVDIGELIVDFFHKHAGSFSVRLCLHGCLTLSHDRSVAW